MQSTNIFPSMKRYPNILTRPPSKLQHTIIILTLINLPLKQPSAVQFVHYYPQPLPDTICHNTSCDDTVVLTAAPDLTSNSVQSLLSLIALNIYTLC